MKYKKINKKRLFFVFSVVAIGICSWLVLNIRRHKFDFKAFKDSNIILVGIDTCRQDHMSCFGYELDTTPNLKTLAQDCILFTNTISQSPWTLPSFASIFTSTYPSVHRARGKAEGDKFYPIIGSLNSGVEILSSSGFKTKAYINGPYLAPAFGLSKGFDDYDYAHGSNAKIRRSDETVNRALEWIKENSEEQFFLFLHFFDPHLNYDPPRRSLQRLMKLAGFEYSGTLKSPFSQLKEVRNNELLLSEEDWKFIQLLYDAEISAVDESCGKLFRFLKANGLYDKSILVVLSDHGEEFLDHGGFEHGHTLYDELINIPLMIKMPSSIRAGEIISYQVRLIDIMPTLLEILDMDIPESFQGESLLRLIKKGRANEIWPAFSEETHWGDELKAVRESCYKFITNDSLDAFQLYNLCSDPGEKNDLANMEKEKAREMRKRIIRWMRSNLGRVRKMRGEQSVDLDKKTRENLRSLGYIK